MPIVSCLPYLTPILSRSTSFPVRVLFHRIVISLSLARPPSLNHARSCKHTFFHRLLSFLWLFAFVVSEAIKPTIDIRNAEDDESVLIPARCSNDGYRVSCRRPHTKPLATAFISVLSSFVSRCRGCFLFSSEKLIIFR